MTGRIFGIAILSVALVALVTAAGVAVASNQSNHDNQSSSSCSGIVNAYSHAAVAALPALEAVAEKHGCDLSGVQRVAKPGNDADEDADDQDADETQEDDQGAGPDVEKKCDMIADKLAAAQARPHGKSADAFERQAERWECESD